MYKSFFGFQQAPFDKGIDSSMLFQSETYKEVLARLDYLKTTRGFGLFTGGWRFRLESNQTFAKWSCSFRFRTPLPTFMLSAASRRSLS